MMYDSDFDSDFDAPDIIGSDDVSDSPGDEEIEFLDTSDLPPDPAETDEIDDEHYHAERMTADEVQRIDDMWKDEHAASDIEPYRATRLSDSADTQDADDDISDEGVFTPESLEDSFAADVESMSFDDLSKEHAWLDELSKMDDMDIFAAYDVQQPSGYNPQLFEKLTTGLSKEQLEYLRDGLASGDKDVYDYFGLNGNGDGDADSPDELKLSRHR